MDFLKQRIVEKKKRKLAKRIVNNFELIYTSCFQISKRYGNSENVPLAVLEVVIKNLKVDLTGSPQEVELYSGVNRVMDTLLSTCSKKAKKLGGKNVPFNFLRHAVDVIKHDFIKVFNDRPVHP